MIDVPEEKLKDLDKKAKELNLDLQKYLQENNNLPFFEKTRDEIITGRLPSNVSDLMIVLKK